MATSSVGHVMGLVQKLLVLIRNWGGRGVGGRGKGMELSLPVVRGEGIFLGALCLPIGFNEQIMI